MTSTGPDDAPVGERGSRAPDPAALGAGEDEGDPVRDPDVIQREIERTRTELAESIDAIADRLSPKRAASRGVAAVRSQLGAASAHVPANRPSSEPTPTPGPLLALPSGSEPASPPRRLRTDRVLVVLGAASAVAAAVVLFRRH